MEKVAPHVLWSPAAMEDLDRVKLPFSFCAFEPFCCRERFISWGVNISRAPPLAAVIDGVFWDDFFFSLMVNERMQVYAELRSKERPYSCYEGQQEKAEITELWGGGRELWS